MTENKNTNSRKPRPKQFIAPGSSLDIPEEVRVAYEQAGYKLRWVRFMLDGKEDSSNVRTRIQEGYEFISPDELMDMPGGKDFLSFIFEDDTRFGRLITFKDVALAKVSVKLNEERKKYFANLTRSQEDAIRGELNKIGGIKNRSKAQVFMGGKMRTTFAED